jgi:hypothetical protein
VFGAALDLGRAYFSAASPYSWVLAWSSAGAGALLGPVMILHFVRLATSRRWDGRAGVSI